MSLKKTLKERPASKNQAATTASFRSPVVVVLGHIDHGKTSLLDKIRQTNVAARETKGITQHIGAYQVRVEEPESRRAGEPENGRAITFIDTPGHAAFSQMRSRGAKVADLAVLVVAADEGFKPQTKEGLDHIQAAKLPFLVAISKVDLPAADVARTEKELAQNGVKVEKEGGEIVAVPVSAKTGQGIGELLEMILLLAEMSGGGGKVSEKFAAVVIESRIDRARGPVATILVRSGFLEVGDEIVIEGTEAKVKAIFDQNGQRVTRALVSQPVEVLGFKEVPPIGGVVRKRIVVDRQVRRLTLSAGVDPVPTVPVGEKEVPASAGTEEEKFKIILKADVSGTLEAILASLPPEIEVISSGGGVLTESDILLASTTNAEVVSFRINPSGAIKKLAETEKVRVHYFQTIYELLEGVEERALKVLEPTLTEEVLGRAEIIAEFEASKQRVAGCRVYEGRMTQKDRLHLVRGTKIVGDARVRSMRVGKQKSELVQKGEEFGVILSPLLDFKVGDVLVSYRPNAAES